jgi:hemerythrin-like metal-binding protein
MLPLVRELIEHVRMHFLHEEELLIAVEYPQAAAHGEIHRKLIARAEEMSDDFERGAGHAGDLLGFLIHDVVARHMLIEDRKFFPWFKKTARAARKKGLPSRPFDA